MSSSLLSDKFATSVKPEGPNHVLEFNDEVIHVEFCPYEWSHELVLICFAEKLVAGVIKFQEEHEYEQLESVNYEPLEEFEHSRDRVRSISWHPDTSLKEVPKYLSFACANSNSQYTIQVYQCTVGETTTQKLLTGHSKYVNAVAYQPAGELLGSVSDDLTFRVWSIENDYELQSKFYLCSPGMDICWHGSEKGKVAVGELSGTVRLYNVNSGVAVMSFRSDLGPLSSLDWSPNTNLYIAALCGEFLIVWQLSSPSSPHFVRSVHSEGGRKLKFSRLTDQKIVTLGAPDNSLKVTVLSKPHSVVLSTLKLASGLTWHHHLPYACVGVDKNVHIWKIN